MIDILSLLVALLAITSPISAALAITTPISAAPPAWTPTGRVLSDDDTIGVTFALQLSNTHKLHDDLRSRSDPNNSKLYGKYRTIEEINKAYPTVDPNSASKVAAWIRSAAPTAVIDVSAYGFVVATIPVRAASVLFDNELIEYTKSTIKNTKSTKSTAIRSVSPTNGRQRTLPAPIAEIVDFVSGLDYFPTFHSNNLLATDVTSPSNLGVDPPSLRARYKIGSITCTHPNTTQATANFLGEGYSDDDLRFFFEVFYGDGEGQKVSKVVGTNNDPSLEASLDIQYISSIGQGATTWWISDDDVHDQQEPFLAYMVLMSKTADTPWVHSISYADLEWSADVTYAKRVDQEFMKAGLRGISILVASGDDGAGCSNNTKSFVVEWPSSSPYITAVGATTIPPSSSEEERSSAVESTASLSGGGFSSIYDERPSWQTAAVESYLNELKKDQSKAPPASYYSTKGRAVPDVSVMGTLFSIIVSQTPSVVSGTSASTPTWAGIISLLNDARFHNNMPPMGFLNPWLYNNSQAFRDITTGTSTPGGMVSSTCGAAQSGWPATTGYDLGTGLGVPDFGKLRAAAVNGTQYFH
mgnify:CR=1 FL=1